MVIYESFCGCYTCKHPNFFDVLQFVISYVSSRRAGGRGAFQSYLDLIVIALLQASCTTHIPKKNGDTPNYFDLSMVALIASNLRNPYQFMSKER